MNVSYLQPLMVTINAAVSLSPNTLPDCPHNFPSAEGYKMITEADVTAAKAHKTKKTVAAVVLATTPTAAFLLPVAVVMPNLSLSVLCDSSESEYVLAPFHTLHYKWDCPFSGPLASSKVEVSALIDNSSQSVLISPDLVNFLGLTCHPLPTPEEVKLAMASGVKKTCTFVDWVPLGIVSSDQSWSL
jgi:hypothetical protein